MLLKKLIELHQDLTYKEYELLLKVVKDDIEFGKDLGIEYTDTKILNVINNTVNLIPKSFPKSISSLTTLSNNSYSL